MVLNTTGPHQNGWHLSDNIFNTLGPRQNGRHFADDIFKCIFVNENVWIPIKISLKFVPKGSINNNPVLFQIMAWRRPGNKPLSEPMMVCSLTHICVTRLQWVKYNFMDENAMKIWKLEISWIMHMVHAMLCFRDHSGMGSVNEKRRYVVTSFPVGLAQTQNDPCVWLWYFAFEFPHRHRPIIWLFQCQRSYSKGYVNVSHESSRTGDILFITNRSKTKPGVSLFARSLPAHHSGQRLTG